MHVTSSAVDWYATRAAGIAAYVLLSAVVVLGLTMASQRRLVRWPRFAIEEVHRVGGLLVGSFVVLHIVTVAIDKFLPFSVADLFVPGLAGYRPLWTALGVVAAELLLALAFTNHYRNRLISYAVWRRVHYLNFAVWLASTLHGVGSGTDRSEAWLLAMYAVSTACVGAAIAWRFLPFRTLVPAAGVATAGAVVALGLGPLRFPPPPLNTNVADFNGRVTGIVDRRLDALYTAIVVSGVGGGRQRVWFRADVIVKEKKGLMGSSFQMEYLPSLLRCRGSISHIEAFAFRAHCRTRSGRRQVVDVHWKPSSGGKLAGAVITSRGEGGVTERG